LWSLFEEIDPDFAGIGQVDTASTISQPEVKLWAMRGLYFWSLNGAQGDAGLPKEEMTLTERARIHAAVGAGFDDDEDLDDDEEVAVS
jgi:hypothetical protein